MTRGDLEEALRPRRSLSLESTLLVCAGSLFIITAAIGSLPEQAVRAAATRTPTPPTAETNAVPASGRACTDDLEELRAGLRSLHRGEEPDKHALLELAERLGDTCDRQDAVRVTRHLVALDNLQAMVAGAGVDQVQEALDTYSDHSSLDRASLLRSLQTLTRELDQLRDPLPAAYARRICSELLLRNNDSDDSALAAALAEHAVGTYERVGFYEQEVEVLEVLARAHLTTTELRAAREEATRGLRLARQISDSLYESLFLRTLVRVADRTGAGLERERLLREWGEFARDPHRTELEEWWAWTQETVAWLIDEDHPERALSFFKETLFDRQDAQGIDPLSSPKLRRQAHNLEATLLIRSGELERARALLQSGITYNDRSRLLRAYLELRTLDDANERESQRIFSELSVLLSEEWISKLPPELLDIGEIYSGEHHYRAGRPELARVALEGAARRALELDRGLAPRSTAGESASLGGEALGLHAVQLLARTYIELGRPLLAARVIEEMQARSLRTETRALEETDLLNWAANNELGLVTWALGPDEGVALWVGAQGQTDSCAIPYGRRPLQRAVSRLTQALREGNEADSESFGLELAESLLPSALLELLATSPGGHLLLLTHGPLESLPVNALRVSRSSPQNAELLSEATTLRTLPGLPALHPGSSALEGADWILAGAPVGIDGRPRLLEALDELQRISERRPCDLLVGAEMTREAMISAIAGEACLHVATHVMWIETEDGPGPAWELAGGATFAACDLPSDLGMKQLVVLMGCESAGGQVLDGEGVLGFSRAFLETGTRGVVATLWPVPDGAARDFGVAFHEALLAKSSPSEAVRSAGRRLREAGSQDWAAFQLFGRD
jgi:CHAT domain-containing protein